MNVAGISYKLYIVVTEVGTQFCVYTQVEGLLKKLIKGLRNEKYNFNTYLIPDFNEINSDFKERRTGFQKDQDNPVSVAVKNNPSNRHPYISTDSG